MALLSLGLGAGAAYAEATASRKSFTTSTSRREQLNATLGNIQNHINAVGKEKIDLGW